jgi:hypothetical protein
LKEEALDRTLWKTRFGRGYGPVVRQITEWMNEWISYEKFSVQESRVLPSVTHWIWILHSANSDIIIQYIAHETAICRNAPQFVKLIFPQ